MTIRISSGNNPEKPPFSFSGEADDAAQNRLKLLVEQSQRGGKLDTRNLHSSHLLTVEIVAVKEGELQFEQDRTVMARLVDKLTGTLVVVGDSADEHNSWLDYRINLGSYPTSTTGPINRVGLVPNHLTPNQGVVVDTAGERFRSDVDTLFLHARYGEIFVNESQIF